MAKTFPQVSGRNIDGVVYNLPQDFEADYNLVLMAFTRMHQYTVDTWLPSLREYEAGLDNFKVYELPTLAKFNWLARKQLDLTMSRGIADPVARATTITLYMDLDVMQKALGYPDYNDIRIYLIDRKAVYWETAGQFTEAKFADLHEVMTGLQLG